eukprot:Gb_35298 [translate_table: standard]
MFVESNSYREKEWNFALHHLLSKNTDDLNDKAICLLLYSVERAKQQNMKSARAMAEGSESTPSSLRWRLLRQALLPRLSSPGLSSQEDMKQISRRPGGGFSLIPCHIVDPQEQEHLGSSMHTVLAVGTKDMLIEYKLPLSRTVRLTLLQRREDCVDLRDFEICKQHEIDNTGVVCLWPSEEVLTYFCISHGHMFRNKRVLELGSGYGLAGLAIAACTEAAEVVISDGNPQVVDYIHQNIKANVGSFGTTKVTSLLLHWNQEEACYLGRSFDFILAADCTFFKESHASLAHTVKSLLESSKMSEAIFFSPSRGNTLDIFLQTVTSLGLHVKVVENYDSHVWGLHSKLMEHDHSSWPNYNKEHFYPLLITISSESELSSLSK